MLNKLRNLFVEEEGQGMTEYGLVLGIIGIGAVAALVLLRDEITKLIDNIKGTITKESTDIAQ